jgi:hypothetical protein
MNNESDIIFNTVGGTIEPCPPPVGYVNPQYRDINTCEDKNRKLMLTPWTVQNICYELIANYMLTNDPKEQGYVFSQRYDRDPRKTQIFLDIVLNYRDDVVQKRPAVFVGRGPAQYRYPTMNQQIGSNSPESEKTKLAIITMPIVVTVIGTNVGFTEQVAEYISNGFLFYLEQIRTDFNFRIFRLEDIGNPTLYLESKDHFAIPLNLMTSFDLGFTIKGDHLKLKTIGYTVFTSCVESPLLNQ